MPEKVKWLVIEGTPGNTARINNVGVVEAENADLARAVALDTFCTMAHTIYVRRLDSIEPGWVYYV